MTKDKTAVRVNKNKRLSFSTLLLRETYDVSLLATLLRFFDGSYDLRAGSLILRNFLRAISPKNSSLLRKLQYGGLVEAYNITVF